MSLPTILWYSFYGILPGDEMCYIYTYEWEWVVDRIKLLLFVQGWVGIGSREEV